MRTITGNNWTSKNKRSSTSTTEGAGHVKEENSQEGSQEGSWQCENEAGSGHQDLAQHQEALLTLVPEGETANLSFGKPFGLLAYLGQ
jgi:hypothetical protein